MNLLLYSIDPQSAAFVLFGILMVCLFISAIFYFKAKHNEKMLLIEKGLTNSPLPRRSENSLQRIGIIIIAISIGIMIVTILHSLSINVPEGLEVALVGIIGGLGMVYANRLDKKS
ncbi:DUF6249 domain-containing protein [Daejeonella lutea]|uniref:DUF6249 domain-containing protein n=1 Tax=Daejeonella lutea TaxID=572036 RepID=A0A1T5AA62_9SPHI|nr:DUF6249 domain-containing protein [Daejeonella lutea]SKB31563.1 hypothetical protein SAMN05661099_0483 [Daejeonella lutea]